MAKKTKMRGGLIQRGEGRWTCSLSLGYSDPDPVTGKRRILQRWISLGQCTRAQAKAKRDELQVAVRKDEFVAPTKRTVGEWLTTWLDESVRPVRRLNTVAAYEQAITKHLTPALGSIGLQALRPGHLAKYYADKRSAGLAGATLAVHHSVVSAALKSALKRRLRGFFDGFNALGVRIARRAQSRRQPKSRIPDVEATYEYINVPPAATPPPTAAPTLHLSEADLSRCERRVALEWASTRPELRQQGAEMIGDHLKRVVAAYRQAHPRTGRRAPLCAMADPPGGHPQGHL